MSTCVVCCSSLAAFYCMADKCMLCASCDKTIHNSNIISRGHKRVPVCELCKRQPAESFCEGLGCQACLCPVCEKEIHASTPLGVPHTVVPIQQAMANGLVQSPGQSPAPAAAPATPAEDETSACGEHAAETAAPKAQELSSEASLAVVPDMMAAAVPSAPVDPTLKPFKDLDALDFEATWFGNLDMGLDFSDILGNVDDVPGLVPSVDAVLSNSGSAPTPTAVPAPVKALPEQPVDAFALALPDSLGLAPSVEDEFVVPSFLPDDLMEEAMPPAMGVGTKRSLAMMQEPAMLQPSAAKLANTGLAMAPAVPQPMMGMRPLELAPPPPPAIAPVAAAAPSHHKSSAPNMNGANLTREQRVARYREKRKNRKFHKTIRYASRKAYAEVRPRIKGRFATKEEVEAWKAGRLQMIDGQLVAV